MPLSSVYEAVCPGLARTPLSAPSPLEVGEASTQAWHLLPAYAAAAAAAAAGLRGFLSSPLLCLASPGALASGPAQLVLGQAPSSFPLLSFQPCARQAPVPTGLPVIALQWEEAGDTARGRGRGRGSSEACGAGGDDGP